MIRVRNTDLTEVSIGNRVASWDAGLGPAVIFAPSASPPPSPPPTNGILLEDATSFLVMEDTTNYLLQEA
jgi:hypothetical protein